MIFGFVGKGGSGKSSLATQVALFLHGRGKRVLAVDADHNMDLSYNLAGGALPRSARFLGVSLADIMAAVGLGPADSYRDALERLAEPCFTLAPADAFTARYTLPLRERLSLMAAGPQTEEVLHGHTCSHALSTSLKVYLPLVALGADEAIVVDEKAGADGVTTGIASGFDVAVVVAEPTLHSVKAARQLADLLGFYGTPYVFAGNKIASESDVAFIEANLPEKPAAYFPASETLKRTPGAAEAAWDAPLAALCDAAKRKTDGRRLERSRAKFARSRAALAA